MKNLKKLDRQEQKAIKGGGLIRCSDHSQCFGGWCCNGTCVIDACLEF